ncbi:MAG: 16S rRNA (guanine(527)-N(7))-methyltransferase RsmG [Desulfobacteraceae bacterium]|nr:16S rRNA (guanine(527)-N(7))-methyltransferase RsmG [Desulfobacteraceae bacterium]MDH3575738.1 16S rRNA (guanine(527)-N(7))-methyltransferase RsmG [Desulfobacteraceae bacterium]MDH3875112.1 16S rRNA (guanine(527)-N(7))-methyltransferase RsmG [Desulfobacteraceae bacterium]
MHEMMQVGSKKWQNLIYEGAKNLDIEIDKRKTEKFAIHAIELMKWNQKTNLTAITDPFEIAVKHFLDSIVPVKIIPSNASLLDIGTGGGFPGIPLKIILPSLSVTMIDASRKKVSFLKHIIRTLELKNTDALHIRAEEFANKPGVKKKFDVIISRALSSMTSFAMTALPFLNKEGAIIAMRGNVSCDDFQLLRSSVNKRQAILLDGDTEAFEISVKRYSLPYLKSDRSMVSLKKVQGSVFKVQG